jgi:hypothetical protein
MDIMRAACKAIELHQELAEKGSRLALSDVGVGVAFCKSASHGRQPQCVHQHSKGDDRQGIMPPGSKRKPTACLTNIAQLAMRLHPLWSVS